MGLDKTEFPPLFPRGFLEVEDPAEFEALFVHGFAVPERRAHLVERLRAMLRWLETELPIEWEVWLDGSFCTEKEDPDDIDIACFYRSDQLDALQGKHAIMARALAGFAMNLTLKQRYECDCYFIVREDAADRDYWIDWFGFSRSREPKGIPRIWLNRIP